MNGSEKEPESVPDIWQKKRLRRPWQQKAARKALRKAGVDASEVELVIVATITGDTDTPSTACKVQAQIGCRPMRWHLI